MTKEKAIRFKSVIMSELKTKHDDFKSIVYKSLILSIVLFMSLITEYAVYGVMLVAAFFIITERSARRLYYMIFLLPFLNIIRINTGQLYFSIYLWVLVLLILVIQLVLDVIKKKKKLNLFFTIMCLVLAIYFAIPFGPFDFTTFGAIYLTLAIIFIIYNYADEFDFKEIIFLFFIGAIIASLFGLCRDFFPRAQEVIPRFYDHAIRFTGVSNDPNYYSGDLILILSGFMTLYSSRNIKYFFYPVFTILTIFAVMSLSKMMLITYGLLVVVFVVYTFFKNYFKKGAVKTIAMLLCFMISCGVTYKQLDAIFLRLTYDSLDEVKTEVVIPPSEEPIDEETSGEDSTIEDSTVVIPPSEEPIDEETSGEDSTIEDSTIYVYRNNKLTALTTGRTNIWLGYFDHIFSNPKAVLFGHGIGAPFLLVDNGYKVDYFAEHNTFVQMLYRIGVLGMMLIIVTVMAAFKKEKFKKDYLKELRFYNFFVLIVVFMLFMALCNMLSYRISIYILVLSMSLTYRSSSLKENNAQLEGANEKK